MPLFKIDRLHVVAAPDKAAALTALAEAKNVPPEDFAELEANRYLDHLLVTLVVEGEEVTKTAGEWAAEKGTGVLASTEW